jgi:alpha-galactosidase
MQFIVDGILLSLSQSGALSLMLGLISLTGGWPMVDGVVYSDVPALVVEQSANTIVVDYDLGPATGQMRVQVTVASAQALTVQYSMRNVPPNRNFSDFGLHFQTVSGVHRYLRSGYNSWDGSYFVEPGELRRLGHSSLRWDRGFGVTELIPSDGRNAMLLGFDRHDRFQQTFTFGNVGMSNDLAILTWWDQKSVSGGQDRSSEKLYVLQDRNYEAALRRWAQVVASNSPLPPRTASLPVIGWNSWYGLYNNISEPLVLESLAGVSAVVQKEHLPMSAFVIDSGFTSEPGDWLTTDYSFPGGMTPVIQKVREAGFTPGLWIAPLLVGNRSRLYRDHPDWVIKSRLTSRPMLLFAFYGENRLGHARSEEYYVLDVTNPAALDYLKTVFRTWRRDWGVAIFKIDATIFGLDWGPQDVNYFEPGLTRIEVWQRFARTVREEIGPDAIWMASGQPLFASVGIADTMRIAGDVGVQWEGAAAAQSLVRDLPLRNFTNYLLWQVDPDPVLLRDQFHYLTDTEVRSLTYFSAMSGGVMMTSDNLAELSSDRLELWKSVLSTDKLSARYPLLGRENSAYALYVPPGGLPEPVNFPPPLTVQVRDYDGGRAATVHILNISSGTVSRTLTLEELGIAGTMLVYDWIKKSSSSAPVDRVTFTLAPHESTLLILTRPAQNSVIEESGSN